MVVELPEKFLRWNYYPRRVSAKAFLESRHERDMNRFFLESTRHSPALCTAYRREDGSIFVNAKIVGAGYVLKKDRLRAATEAFRQHLENGDRLFEEAGEDKRKQRETMDQYQREAMWTLMEHIYLPKQDAHAFVDFTKMSTLELAKSKPSSSKHTWQIVQKNQTACLLFYEPPGISFELRGMLDIYVKGDYYDFVNAVHDAFHYVPKEKRKIERPVYIFNVEETYDNSPQPNMFGAKIA